MPQPSLQIRSMNVYCDSGVIRSRMMALAHMWNGPEGKDFFAHDTKTGGAVICPALRFGHMTDGHDEIRNARSPNQFCALEGAVRQTV